tara:strand:+ start:3074 stop:3763 length:690 start_codon:yes stop_codon:yes gene_type:complete
MKAFYSLLIFFIFFFTSFYFFTRSFEPENHIKQDYKTIYKETFFYNEHCWHFEYDSVIVIGKTGNIKKRYFIPPGTKYRTYESYNTRLNAKDFYSAKRDSEAWKSGKLTGVGSPVTRIADERIYFNLNYDWHHILSNKYLENIITLEKYDGGTGLGIEIECNPKEIQYDSTENIVEVYFIWDEESFSSLTVNFEDRFNPGSLEDPYRKYVHPKVIEIIEKHPTLSYHYQ